MSIILSREASIKVKLNTPHPIDGCKISQKKLGLFNFPKSMFKFYSDNQEFKPRW